MSSLVSREPPRATGVIDVVCEGDVVGKLIYIDEWRYSSCAVGRYNMLIPLSDLSKVVNRIEGKNFEDGYASSDEGKIFI